MEKLARFVLNLVIAIWERLEGKKADQAHADSVRNDPAAAWLRRFGGKDARNKNSSGSANSKLGSD